MIIGEKELLMVIEAFAFALICHFKTPYTKLPHKECVFCKIEKQRNDIGRHHLFFHHLPTIFMGQTCNDMRYLRLLNNAVYLFRKCIFIVRSKLEFYPSVFAEFTFLLFYVVFSPLS